MSTHLSTFYLPPHAANKLLNDRKLRKLFELSQLSTEDYDLVKNTMYGSKGELDVRFGKKTTVELHLGGEKLTWAFYQHRDPKRFCLEQLDRRTLKLRNDIDRTTISIEYCQESVNRFGCKLNSMEGVFKFIEYIAHLFNISILNLQFGERGYDFTSNRTNSKLEYLGGIQSTEILKKCQKVRVHGGTVSHDRMRRLLEGWSEEVKEIGIWCYPEPNFHYDKVVSVPTFEIWGGHWFKGPMLLKLDCELVTLYTWQLTNEDINVFMQHWINSSSKKIQALIIIKTFNNWENVDCYEDAWMNKEKMEEEHSFDLDKITDGLSNCTVHEPDVQKRGRVCRERDGSIVQLSVHDRSGIVYDYETAVSCYFTYI